METRGSYGFVYNGIYKMTYNHYDSYPSELGKNIADFCREVAEKGQLDVLRERVDNLILVEHQTEGRGKNLVCFICIAVNISLLHLFHIPDTNGP